MSSFGLFLILFSRSVFSTRSLLISFATPHCASLRYACMGLLGFRAFSTGWMTSLQWCFGLRGVPAARYLNNPTLRPLGRSVGLRHP